MRQLLTEPSLRSFLLFSPSSGGRACWVRLVSSGFSSWRAPVGRAGGAPRHGAAGYRLDSPRSLRAFGACPLGSAFRRGTALPGLSLRSAQRLSLRSVFIGYRLESAAAGVSQINRICGAVALDAIIIWEPSPARRMPATCVTFFVPHGVRGFLAARLTARRCPPAALRPSVDKLPISGEIARLAR